MLISIATYFSFFVNDILAVNYIYIFKYIANIHNVYVVFSNSILKLMKYKSICDKKHNRI